MGGIAAEAAFARPSRSTGREKNRAGGTLRRRGGRINCCHAELALAARGGPFLPARQVSRVARGAALISCLLLPAVAHAQTDEIQVYAGEINKPGQFRLRCTTTIP
jgi:hypothetical protein